MRTHYCGLVTEKLIGKTVTVCGWVHRRRDHGGVVFVDLRDRDGLLQIVSKPDNSEVFKIAETLRGEYVIQVTGEVCARPEGTTNSEMHTGKIEINAQSIEILNKADTPPFFTDEHYKVSEELRLRYRYIDLRRPEMQKKIQFRSQLVTECRDYLNEHRYMEVETPYLTRSTPEGARDYLVPCRSQAGTFYALPQSPQLFKQLLMMAGMDRYYQVVRCFRDEDLRADRQPEFTQLDIEMSFMDEVAIQEKIEGLLHHLFKKLLDVELTNPFPKMTYAEAVDRFGTDRPDMRIPLELIDVGELMRDVEFKVFSEPANNPNGRVAALRLPGGAKLSRKEIDDYTKFVSIYGAKGLAYIKVNDKSAGREGLQSPILKFFTDDIISALLEKTAAVTGDIIFFGSDRAKIVNESLAALRDKLGHDQGLVEESWRPLWVIDFPMFETEKEEQHWQSMHHPFTAPQDADIETIKKDPGASISRAYDIVLNGSEIGGGSIRIHNPEMQYAVLELLGFTREHANQRFGFLIEALRYGCPPHGGFAFGLDRLVMLMCGADSIRDVIPFPKTQTGNCPLTSAPAEVEPKQLLELGITIPKINKEETVT